MVAPQWKHLIHVQPIKPKTKLLNRFLGLFRSKTRFHTFYPNPKRVAKKLRQPKDFLANVDPMLLETDQDKKEWKEHLNLEGDNKW